MARDESGALGLFERPEIRRGDWRDLDGSVVTQTRKRQCVFGAGLILTAGWALLTIQNENRFSGNEPLWMAAAQDSSTVRAHVNAREAALMHGDIFGALAECRWLLDKLESGWEPLRPYSELPADWRAQISAVCLRARDSPP